MSTAVMAIEGVLGDSLAFDITMQSSPVGRELFETLSVVYRVVLVTTQPDSTKAEHWLRSNGIGGYSQVLVGTQDAIGTTANRVAQLRALRASRVPVSLFVDVNPEAVVYASRVGITGLRWTPAVRGADREDMRPAPIRSWETMVPDGPRIP